MPFGTKPPADVRIDLSLVGALIQEQHPDLAHLALSEIGEGWDNRLFRLGDDLAVRVPRRAISAVLIEQEQRWLPRLAPQLPLPIPVPSHSGGFFERSTNPLPGRLPMIPGEVCPSPLARVSWRTTCNTWTDSWTELPCSSCGSARFQRLPGRDRRCGFTAIFTLAICWCPGPSVGRHRFRRSRRWRSDE
jgi:hypothetical protein